MGSVRPARASPLEAARWAFADRARADGTAIWPLALAASAAETAALSVAPLPRASSGSLGPDQQPCEQLEDARCAACAVGPPTFWCTCPSNSRRPGHSSANRRRGDSRIRSRNRSRPGCGQGAGAFLLPRSFTAYPRAVIDGTFSEVDIASWLEAPFKGLQRIALLMPTLSPPAASVLRLQR